ncbi:MAG: sensor histidine kinase [Planctomycetota bacterium]|nr:MAG: sensor histidine kinase [Planctomycetota bacterium]
MDSHSPSHQPASPFPHSRSQAEEWEAEKIKAKKPPSGQEATPNGSARAWLKMRLDRFASSLEVEFGSLRVYPQLELGPDHDGLLVEYGKPEPGSSPQPDTAPDSAIASPICLRLEEGGRPLLKMVLLSPHQEAEVEPSIRRLAENWLQDLLTEYRFRYRRQQWQEDPSTEISPGMDSDGLQLLREIHHDLRNQLQLIQGMAEHLGTLKSSSDASLPWIQELQLCIREAVQLSHLPWQSPGFALPSRRTTEGVQFLQNREKLLQWKAAKHRLQCQIQLPRNPILCTIGETALARILWNLHCNACEATPPGGWIKIGIRRRVVSPQVDLSTSPSSGNPKQPPFWLELWVQDNGVGMKPELITRILQSGYSTKKVPNGPQEFHGIGLRSVKSLIEGSGGKLLVQSQVGKGTRFRIWIPGQPA